MAGGCDGPFNIVNTADLYLPRRGIFIATGQMTDARAEQTATSLKR